MKVLSVKNRVKKLNLKLGETIHLLIAFMIVISAVCLFGIQSYSYLKYGIWLSLSVTDGLAAIGVDWASKPTDWIGLWKLMNKVPLSMSLFFLGLYVYHDYDKTITLKRSKSKT